MGEVGRLIEHAQTLSDTHGSRGPLALVTEKR